MENIFPNDTTITLAGKPYRLRASIAALCAIEQHLNLPIHTLAEHTFTNAQAVFILHAGIDAAGYQPIHITDDEPHLHEYARAFIAGALQDKTELNWRGMFTTFTGIMNRPTAEFWNITLAEYSLIVEGFCLMHGLEPHRALPPATSQDLAEMIRRFG
ncbi:MAG: hypothetical protein ACK502_02910 [Alphaproteobacteria bacterium]